MEKISTIHFRLMNDLEYSKEYHALAEKFATLITLIEPTRKKAA